MRISGVIVLAVCLAVWSGWASGQEAPATAPTTAPAAGVSPEARQILDSVKAAYANLQTLVLAGDVAATFDVAGQKNDEQATFTSSFQAPNKFRHEVKNDILLGSTGEKTYLYHPGQNVYLTSDAPQGRATAADLPGPLPGILQSQNPSLLMAILDDASEDLVNSSQSITQGEDVTLDDGQAYTALEFDSERGHLTMLLDKQTHLVRQARFDLRDALEQSGQPDVKQAEVTVNYTQSQAGGAVDDAQYAWSPPENAKDLTKQMSDGGEESDLKGKPAPDFALNDMDDKPVKLSELQGSVVVLDFWATWCGPCVASMPNLQKLYDEKSAEGLKLYALNIREDKAKVSEFLKSKNLTIPVLFDTDGGVANQYGVQGIPFTLVVGKDGVVREVMVGMGPDSEKTLRSAVEAAMTE